MVSSSLRSYLDDAEMMWGCNLMLNGALCPLWFVQRLVVTYIHGFFCHVILNEKYVQEDSCIRISMKSTLTECDRMCSDIFLLNSCLSSRQNCQNIYQYGLVDCLLGEI